MDTSTFSNTPYCIEFFHAKPGCHEKLKQALQQLAEKSTLEEGCMQYDVLIDETNSNLFILIVRFTNQESMKQHENQPYIINFAESQMNQLCEKVKWYDAHLIK